MAEPLPADQVPHASETIAMVVSWLVNDHIGHRVSIPNDQLVQDRGRVVFKEDKDGVEIWLEPVNRGSDH